MRNARMGRRGLLLALACAAFASGAAPSPENAGQHGGAAKQQIADPSQNMAPPFKEPQKTSKHDEPCRKGDDHRDSDLCAQWKAADAAKSAADAAWWIGGFGTVLGLLTLVVAVAAALYARAAAKHTETGAKEASRAADAAHDANRPWLELIITSHEDFALDAEEYGADFVLNVATVNRGNSPATNVVIEAALTACRIGSENPVDLWKAVNEAEGYLANWDGHAFGSPVFPGEHAPQEIHAVMTGEQIRELRDYPGKSLHWMLAVGVRYSFGNRTGITIAGYHVGFDYGWPKGEITPTNRVKLESSHTGFAL